MKPVQPLYRIDPASQAASEVRSASKHVTSVSVEVSEPGSLDVVQLLGGGGEPSLPGV
ncbi:MAG TPA: hypothetical protein VLH87_03740 [Pyrinomonadaceae bacterium]|nr:hypothetical protein [Pyrinomonadaceae bacterium]